MRIHLVTPSKRGSRTGNRVTAERWARLLRELDHRVTVTESFAGQRCDVMIALHARRSAHAARRFRQMHPDGPLVVVLTGTDLYSDLPDDREAQHSLEIADMVVVLQRHGLAAIPRQAWRDKARVVLQSVSSPTGPEPEPRRRTFDVCVVGHLRAAKDPLRTAHAARQLSAESRIAVLHAGAAIDARFGRMALAETERNPRYTWLGSYPRGRARHLIRRSKLMVLTSKSEGAAHVLAEAIVAGTPVLATAIDGLTAQLGNDYPGLFPVGDTLALCALMSRAERDNKFYGALLRWCNRLKPNYHPDKERQALAALLRVVMAGRA